MLNAGNKTSPTHGLKNTCARKILKTFQESAFCRVILKVGSLRHSVSISYCKVTLNCKSGQLTLYDIIYFELPIWNIRSTTNSFC